MNKKARGYDRDDDDDHQMQRCIEAGTLDGLGDGDGKCVQLI